MLKFESNYHEINHKDNMVSALLEILKYKIIDSLLSATIDLSIRTNRRQSTRHSAD